ILCCALALCAVVGIAVRGRCPKGAVVTLYVCMLSLGAIFKLGTIVGGGMFAIVAGWLFSGTVMFVGGAVFNGICRIFVRVGERKAVRKEERDPKAARRRKKKAARSTLLIACIVLPISVALVAARTQLSVDSLDGVDGTPVMHRSSSVNVLICGIDNDPNDPAHQQKMTDVIIVANVDWDKGRASLLQIPRDTFVGQEHSSTGKINGVYARGDAQGDGVAALAKVINSQMALPLDNYVTITMEGFRAAVDALKGVEVVLDEPMTFHYKDANENITGTVTLPAGPNLLDGATADLFVRYRDYARADLDRMDVQRYFLAALLRRARAVSAGELISAVSAAYPHLDTDLTAAELMSYAFKARGFGADAIVALRVPGEPVSNYGSAKQSVFSIHKTALTALLNENMRPYGGSVPESELGAIELKNTTEILDDWDEPLDDYAA
ncbi:MAG: LCP family protein, partial [Oscillospiraceae bacterium]